MLLHLIIKGLFKRNVITLNSLLIKIASFTVYNRANNLASMLNVITIPYVTEWVQVVIIYSEVDIIKLYI